MLRLFRSFERAGLRYLLISGQASVLYGAATFSEDIDLWISPEESNARALLGALARCGAKVHKLTPPLEARYLRAGHGFHFIIPAGPAPVFLDVMARPPRVGAFAPALRRARWMDSGWGRVPVVGIEDLVALKMTRRLSDYEVISNLVGIRVAQEAQPLRRLLRWAAAFSFRAEDRVEYLRRLGVHKDVEACRREIAVEVAALQARDVRYWRTRIAELRRLRRDAALLPLGMKVSELAPNPAAKRPRG